MPAAAYVYIGDPPELRGARCEPVLRADGKAVVDGGSQVVRFEDGVQRTVFRRSLRRAERFTAEDVADLRNPELSGAARLARARTRRGLCVDCWGPADGRYRCEECRRHRATKQMVRDRRRLQEPQADRRREVVANDISSAQADAARGVSENA